MRATTWHDCTKVPGRREGVWSIRRPRRSPSRHARDGPPAFGGCSCGGFASVQRGDADPWGSQDKREGGFERRDRSPRRGRSCPQGSPRKTENKRKKKKSPKEVMTKLGGWWASGRGRGDCRLSAPGAESPGGQHRGASEAARRETGRLWTTCSTRSWSRTDSRWSPASSALRNFVHQYQPDTRALPSGRLEDMPPQVSLFTSVAQVRLSPEVRLEQPLVPHAGMALQARRAPYGAGAQPSAAPLPIQVGLHCRVGRGRLLAAFALL